MYTLQIDGIDGGLALTHAKGHFLMKHLLFSVTGPQHSPNTNNNTVTGSPTVREFGAIITPSLADAILVGKALKGETLKSVAVTLWTTNDGKPVKVQTFTLTECTIAEFATCPPQEGGPAQLLRFNAVSLKLESFKPDGTASGSSSYNFREAKAA